MLLLVKNVREETAYKTVSTVKCTHYLTGYRQSYGFNINTGRTVGFDNRPC